MSTETWLIVGLGNIGARYDGTRHNVGFAVLDRLASSLAASGSSKRSKWTKGETLDVRDGAKKLILLWPSTYMNASGEAVQEVSAFASIPPEQIVVIQDDIDLPVGKLRIRKGGGDGGQKGIRSTAERLGTSDFIRVKFGVGRPPHPSYEVADWVLSKFAGEEKSLVEEATTKAIDAVRTIVSEGFLKAQNRYNG